MPGAYGLDPTSPDEAVTRDVLLGKQQGERLPDALLIVVDASNLDNHLRFTLQLIDLGLPTVVALNMVDLATRDGLELDAAKLSAELGVPVIETVAVRKRGLDDAPRPARRTAARPAHDPRRRRARATTRSRSSAAPATSPSARSSAKPRCGGSPTGSTRVLLHPFAGPLILAAILFVMFQAVFAWSAIPADALEAATIVGSATRSAMRCPTACCAR